MLTSTVPEIGVAGRPPAFPAEGHMNFCTLWVGAVCQMGRVHYDVKDREGAGYEDIYSWSILWGEML